MNFLSQYANIIIPLVVSIVGAVLTFLIAFSKLENKVNNTEKLVDEIRKDMKEIRDKVIACEIRLIERGPVIRRESPLKLTERGDNLLKASGGKIFVDTNLNSLKDKIKEYKPKNAYDIQETSKKAIGSLSTSDCFTPLKDYLFKEGETLDDLIIVMGLYLRDLTLPDYGYKLDEIDKDDPKCSK